MIDEAKFVEDSFRRNFNLDDCIAIYGLGKNTKVIVENCPEYNIVALMDRNRTGESEWGHMVHAGPLGYKSSAPDDSAQHEEKAALN